jgi:hypothetical protein
MLENLHSVYNYVLIRLIRCLYIYEKNKKCQNIFTFKKVSQEKRAPLKRFDDHCRDYKGRYITIQLWKHTGIAEMIDKFRVQTSTLNIYAVSCTDIEGRCCQ